MSKKQLNHLFKKVRELELHRASDATIQETILETLKELATTFEKHDEKEIQKNDRYDEHIQQNNRQLTELATSIDGLKKGQEDYRVSLSTVKTEMKEDVKEIYKEIAKQENSHKQDFGTIEKSIGKLFTYANRVIGVILFVLATSGIVWGIISYYIEKEEKLLNKVEKLERNQNRNYDRSIIERDLEFRNKVSQNKPTE